MPIDDQHTPAPPLDKPVLGNRAAWVALVAGLAMSVGAWWGAARHLQDEADAAFRRDAADVSARLDDQMTHHLVMLKGFQALFAAYGDAGREAFHRHYEGLNAERTYPAMWAVHYAPLVSEDDRPAFEAAVQADRTVRPDGHPGFHIRPAEPARATYVPITYVEPAGRIDAMLGHDLLDEAARRQAVVRAQQSGQIEAAPPLQIQGITQGSGVVVRLPVYRGGAVPASEPARRAAFQGVVSGVLECQTLMRQVAGRLDWRDLHWRVEDRGPLDGIPDHDSADVLPVVFDSASLQGAWAGPDAVSPVDDRDRAVHTLGVAGRRWALTFTRPPVRPLTAPYPLALLLGGVAGSVGLWWAWRNRGLRAQQAAALADELSARATDNERRLRAIMDHTVDGIITVAPSGRVLSLNASACRMFARHADEVLGQHLRLLLPEAGRHERGGRVEQFLQQQCTGMDGLGQRTEGLRGAAGSVFPLELSVSSMVYKQQKHYILIVRDLSTQETAERAVLEAQRQLNEVDEMRRVIVHHAPYAICVLNGQGVIQAINPAGERLLGQTAMELVGRSTATRFFDPEQVAERTRMLAMRMERPAHTVNLFSHLADQSPGIPTEWLLRRGDGQPLIAELSVTELRNEHDQLTGYLAMAQDVTSRREAEKQVQHMARHDALTGLPNRNMLQEQLKVSLAQAERHDGAMAMMFLDLDRFKKINDSLGHHIGDHVLIEAARRLSTAMRTSDIVARLGGDEFVVLLTQIAEPGDGMRVADKLMALFAEPLRVGPHELRVTPSIGLALYPEHGRDAVTLMRHADLAMYQAKHAGRNRIQVYSDRMESPSAESLILENDLYKALERDELRLHFQPQFSCRTGAITGAEALLRWEHKGKLVSPAEFIPLAEETGLIVSMGRWVLRRACALAQRWRTDTDWPLRVAVNLSAVQLDRPDIVDEVRAALSDTGLPATALELEITESVVVRESLRAAAVLNQLRALGVGIAIDDFGVGYSSFAYLRELPVDRFKLDRSFLSAVPQSPGDSRLAAALIAMAHRLEVGIVAEGVETAEQAAFLAAHQCDEAQGYFLGRPMTEDAFGVLLRQHVRTQREAAVSPPDASLAI
ncbi:EAL domain-containing protein [uncultured Aquabacterium sp.]|jgi:diguanylate cyclase (GGDEF)-like protein/PAS domain S-box-containing protein|nr:EAL domain-containing protein [uncultured Aquabacterium sp.]